MGYKDTEWAYGLDLPMREKVVLVAYCHRTDDATHETFVGQKTVAAMLGSSEKHVSRALGTLDRLGAITRTRRTGAGGYRTSDLVRVETSYRTDSPQGQQPTRPAAHQAASPDLPDSQSRPTGPAVRAEEINQIDQPEDQPVLSPIVIDEVVSSFERAWAHWPKKADKKTSLSRYRSAIKARGTLAQLEADVIRFGQAYARSADEMRFVPGLSTWLNRERWNDDLPTPSLTRTEQNLAVVQRLSSRDEQNLAVVARLAAREARAVTLGTCGPGNHKLANDGTCALCTTSAWDIGQENPF